MATGFVQRWKGKIVGSQLWLPKGGFYDAASGVAGSLQGALRVALPVTAVATTDYHFALPVGATMLSAQVYTSVAYTGTTVLVSIGATDGGQDYVAQTTIKTVGFFSLSFVAAGAPGLAFAPALTVGTPSWNFSARITQTGATAVGTGVLVIEYAP